MRERGVSAEEIGAEEWNLAQKEMSDALAKDRSSDYFGWLRELLRIDRSTAPAEKWFGLFVLCYALFYAHTFYVNIQTVVWYLRCEDCHEARPFVILDALFCVYSTIALFLILKQKRLGWALLCIQSVVMNCANLLLFFRLYMRHVELVWQLVTYFLPFVAYTAILVFLFRPYILELFGVDKKYRERVLLIGAGLALLKVLFV